jgi:PIN domain nuclease of toxin-antitoxin system
MILLDTHVLVWAISEPKQLSKRAADAIRRAKQGDGLAISAITLLELATLLVRGRVRAYGSVETSLRVLSEGVEVRPLTIEIAGLAAQFPADYPSDPADRIIGATAKAEGIALITKDQRLHRAELLETIW